LLSYFGEKDAPRCGKCDVCTKRNELDLSQYEFDLIIDKLKELLQGKTLRLEDIIDFIDFEEEKVVKVVRFLLENGKVQYSGSQSLKWSRAL
jgi:ATP-dependent DNA helicase RecQ